jgi:hypothetical protein
VRHDDHRAGGPRKSSPLEPGDKTAWRVVLGPDFLDARANPMGSGARHLLQILDGFARMNPFCWHDNATLSAWTGVEARRIQQLLAELEKSGWVACIYSDAKKRHRLGIIMRRRVGPGTPAADTPGRLADVEVAVRSGWRSAGDDADYWMRRLGSIERNKVRSTRGAPTQDISHLERDKMRSPERNKVRQNKDVAVEENEVKKELNSRGRGVLISPLNGNDQTAEVPPGEARPRVDPYSASYLAELRIKRESQATPRPRGSGDGAKATLSGLASPIPPAELAARIELAPPHVEAPPPPPMPVASVVDRAMVDVRQAASMATEPINAGPGDLGDLTEGQRAFLEGLDPDRRGRFDALDPRRRALLILGFRHGPNPVGESEAEQALRPRESRPPPPADSGPETMPTTATVGSPAASGRESLIAWMLGSGGILAEQARAHIARDRANRRSERQAAASMVTAEDRDAAVARILRQRDVPNPRMLDLLDQVRPGCDPFAISEAVDMFCRVFSDEKSRGWFYSLLNGVRDGEIPPQVPIYAYAHATESGCDEPGRWFNAAVKRCGYDPKSNGRRTRRNRRRP